MGVTKHLGSGSECPPLKSGTLRLYSMKSVRTPNAPAWYWPPKHTTRGSEHSTRQQTRVVRGKEPDGEGACTGVDGQLVPDSLITCDLLEQLYPEPALQHSDPWRRARDRVLVDQFNVCAMTLYKLYYARDNADLIRELSETFNKSIAPFEAELVRRGTPFFHGERPGMLDLMIWPWMERFPAARKLGMTNLPTGEMPPPPPEIHNLHKWVMRMAEHPYVKGVAISTENHMKYLLSWIAGNPDYEMDC